MDERIANDINKILNLPADLLAEFFTKLKPLSVSKGNYFLSEGELCRNIALLTKGVFYSYYQKDGNDIIEDFCLEGCFLADYPAFINNTTAKKNFKAIEDSLLLTISKIELDNLYQSDPAYERAGRLIAEFLFTGWESKLRDNIYLSPSERYKKLIKTRSDIPITIMENFLIKYDVFICPVSSVKAFQHHKPSKSYGNFSIYNNPLQVNNEKTHYYMATQAYTTPFTLTESPVLSMPISLSGDSLPISVQIVGKRYEDFKLLEIGKVINRYTDKLTFPLQILQKSN